MQPNMARRQSNIQTANLLHIFTPRRLVRSKVVSSLGNKLRMRALLDYFTSRHDENHVGIAYNVQSLGRFTS